MNIVRQVRAVEKLFKTLDKDIQKLQSQTGISCIENCIKCCTTTKIVATTLEFYPLAYHLYKTGQAEDFIAKIDKSNGSNICPALNCLSFGEIRPGCTQYDHRGLICRLFSYNYSTDKFGRRKIAACKTIRINQPQQLDRTNEILNEKPLGPKASNYYSRLLTIDFNKGQTLYPINDAIRLAIESVLSYFHYRGDKAG